MTKNRLEPFSDRILAISITIIGREINLALLIYAILLGVAIFQPIAASILYAVVALLWIVADSRIEKILKLENN